MENLKAFQIRVKNKILDYRLGNELDLNKIRDFFQKKYRVIKIWSGGRHVLGILKKGNNKLFLKLATSEGISVVTQYEYKWNEQFNKLLPRKISNFWVPQNKDYGEYKKLFYLITDKFEGKLLAERPGRTKTLKNLQNSLPSIIQFSELIQGLDIDQIADNEDPNQQQWFLSKTKLWYLDIPENIREKYKIMDLLKIVDEGLPKLQRRTRHGDFTPWHLVNLRDGGLGLIDGEHAKSSSVEYYDIGYFIQRVFSVLRNPSLAQNILTTLTKKGYDSEKLKVILAARAIGGFLDESLTKKADYQCSNKFKVWVEKLRK